MSRNKTFQVLVIKVLLIIADLLIVLTMEAQRPLILPSLQNLDKLKTEGEIFISNTTGANKEWWRDES